MEYLLSDKTGTLTQNKMILRGVFIGDRVFGGRLELDEHNYKVFKRFDSDKMDDELIKILQDEIDVKLPHGVDIAAHKLEPTLCMFKEEIEESQMLDFKARKNIPKLNNIQDGINDTYKITKVQVQQSSGTNYKTSKVAQEGLENFQNKNKLVNKVYAFKPERILRPGKSSNPANDYQERNGNENYENDELLKRHRIEEE